MDKPWPFPFKYPRFSAIPDELSEAINDERREIEADEGAGQVGSEPDCSQSPGQADYAPVVPQD